MKITSKQLQDLAEESGKSLDGRIRFWQKLTDKVNDFFSAPEGNFETDKQTSKEYRKNKVLTTITNREPLPEYAGYGNAMGSIYFRFFSEKHGWVEGDIDFYEIIEAVAKRVIPNAK